MAVIPFPLAVQSKRNSRVALRTNQPDVVHNQLHLGPWTFECTRCDAKIAFDTTAMVFRKLDFYCSSCGTLHSVNNPAFVAPTAPKNK
jgi:transcription elongation factor Elf1